MSSQSAQSATYHSLKAVTNWMGYKLMDINYPSLANLTAALQRLDIQMVLLQCIAYNSSEHSNQLYTYLAKLEEIYSPLQDIISDDAQIVEAMLNFRATVQSYYHAVINHSSEFYIAKANYIAQHLHIPSSTTHPR